MSCRVCNEEPLQTYVRVGPATVGIQGCTDHLSQLIRIYHLGLEALSVVEGSPSAKAPTPAQPDKSSEGEPTG